MPSLGAGLRELRQKRGVSLEELARTTRVGQQYLEALESDQLGALPAPVFTRGFIRAYCQALGELADEPLRRYSEHGGTAAVVVASRLGSPRRTGDVENRGRGPVLVSFVLLVVLGLALVAVTLGLQSGREPMAARRADVGPADFRPADFAREPGNSPAPRVTDREPPPAPAAPSVAVKEALPRVPTATSPFRLVARTTETTWIRVRTGDGSVSEESIPPGEVREWVSNRPFVVTIGNAGGVVLLLNGRLLPPLGARGAVIRELVLPPDAQ